MALATGLLLALRLASATVVQLAAAMVPHLEQVVLDFAVADLQPAHSNIALLVKEQAARSGGTHACPSFSFHDVVLRRPDSSLPSAVTIHPLLLAAVVAAHVGRRTDYTPAA